MNSSGHCEGLKPLPADWQERRKRYMQKIHELHEYRKKEYDALIQEFNPELKDYPELYEYCKRYALKNLSTHMESLHELFPFSTDIEVKKKYANARNIIAMQEQTIQAILNYIPYLTTGEKPSVLKKSMATVGL